MYYVHAGKVTEIADSVARSDILELVRSELARAMPLQLVVTAERIAAVRTGNALEIVADEPMHLIANKDMAIEPRRILIPLDDPGLGKPGALPSLVFYWGDRSYQTPAFAAREAAPSLERLRQLTNPSGQR
jgi:hypothetical protein